MSIDLFQYSQEFHDKVVFLHRGKEKWAAYSGYVEQHLGGPHSRLHYFTRYLCSEIEFHCGSLSEKTILDFGCGTGATTAALLIRGARHVHAFDIDAEGLEIAQLRMKEHGLVSGVTYHHQMNS